MLLSKLIKIALKHHTYDEFKQHKRQILNEDRVKFKWKKIKFKLLKNAR